MDIHHLHIQHLHRPGTDAANRPTKHCLYAVFDSEEDAHQAEQALVERSIEVRRPTWKESSGDHNPHKMHAHGIRDALHDVMDVMHELKAEIYELDHYADHAAQGHVVLVACGTGHVAAQQILPLLTRYGAYDVTYFGDWAVTYLSPAEHSAPAVALDLSAVALVEPSVSVQA